MHVRNTSGGERGSWATLVTRVREATGLTKTEMARRIGVDRGTVHRWEMGQNRPEDADTVYRFADLFKIDAHDALAAAGLVRPADTQRPATIDVDLFVIEQKLADPYVNQETKDFIRRTLQHLANLAGPDNGGRRHRAG